MHRISSRIVRSLRRSSARVRVLMWFSSGGPARVEEAATALGMPPHVVRWACVGRLPYYRKDLALVGVGALRPMGADAFMVTPAGARAGAALSRVEHPAWLARRP